MVSKRISKKFPHLLEAEVISSFHTPWPKHFYSSSSSSSLCCPGLSDSESSWSHHRGKNLVLWFQYTPPIPSSEILINHGFIAYLHSLIWKRLTVMLCSFSSLSTPTQDISLELLVVGSLCGLLHLEYYLYHLLQWFILFPPLVILLITLFLFEGGGGGPISSSLSCSRTSQVHVETGSAQGGGELYPKLDRQYLRTFLTLPSEEQSLAQDHLMEYSSVMSIKEDGSPYVVSSSMKLESMETPVKGAAGGSTGREGGMNRLMSPTQSRIHEPNVVSVSAPSPASDEMKNEVQREVIRQLSTLLRSMNISDTVLSPTRLPPLLGVGGPLSSPNDHHTPLSSVTQTDIKYALARLERRDKANTSGGGTSSGGNSARDVMRTRTPKRILVPYQDDDSVGMSSDGVEEFLAISPSATFVVPSVNEFLDNASRGRKLRGPIARKRSSRESPSREQQRQQQQQPQHAVEVIVMSPSQPYDEDRFNMSAAKRRGGDRRARSEDGKGEGEGEESSFVDDDVGAPPVGISPRSEDISPLRRQNYAKGTSGGSLPSSLSDTITLKSPVLNSPPGQGMFMSSTQAIPPIRHEVRHSEVLRFVKSDENSGDFLDQISRARHRDRDRERDQQESSHRPPLESVPDVVPARVVPFAEQEEGEEDPPPPSPPHSRSRVSSLGEGDDVVKEYEQEEE
jgi:hypothetical protein